jgi:hypothetical protein
MLSKLWSLFLVSLTPDMEPLLTKSLTLPLSYLGAGCGHPNHLPSDQAR